MQDIIIFYKEFNIEKKISKEDFDFILEVGRLSPSSFGFEKRPQEFSKTRRPIEDVVKYY